MMMNFNIKISIYEIRLSLTRDYVSFPVFIEHSYRTRFSTMQFSPFLIERNYPLQTFAKIFVIKKRKCGKLFDDVTLRGANHSYSNLRFAIEQKF